MLESGSASAGSRDKTGRSNTLGKVVIVPCCNGAAPRRPLNILSKTPARAHPVSFRSCFVPGNWLVCSSLVAFMPDRRLARPASHAAPPAACAHSSGPPVTFAHDIAPIIYGSCAPCHRPGESGPFPLLTYEDVKKHAHQIVKVTQSHIMPPWLPEPGYGDFVEARYLTDEQIRTIAQVGGARQSVGSAEADFRPSPYFRGLETWPARLDCRSPVPLDVPATGPEVYWNFLLKPRPHRDPIRASA